MRVRYAGQAANTTEPSLANIDDSPPPTKLGGLIILVFIAVPMVLCLFFFVLQSCERTPRNRRPRCAAVAEAPRQTHAEAGYDPSSPTVPTYPPEAYMAHSMPASPYPLQTLSRVFLESRMASSSEEELLPRYEPGEAVPLPPYSTSLPDGA